MDRNLTGFIKHFNLCFEGVPKFNGLGTRGCETDDRTFPNK